MSLETIVLSQTENNFSLQVWQMAENIYNDEEVESTPDGEGNWAQSEPKKKIVLEARYYMFIASNFLSIVEPEVF